MKISLAIVVSEFNSEITFQMLERAKEQAQKSGADIKYVCYVPGSFDMPLMVEELLRRKDVDAAVTLGAVIKGDTRHDDIVAENCARLISDLSIKYRKPVALGITGPGMTVDQARERIGSVPARAVSAAISMVEIIKKIRGMPKEKKRLAQTIIIGNATGTGSHITGEEL